MRVPNQARHWAATILLFLLLTILSLWHLVAAKDSLRSEDSPLLYSAAILSFNYFDFGLVRRGLGGTIVYLLGGDRLWATAVFFVISAICASVTACLLFIKLRRPLLQTMAFALLLVALTMRWAEDYGRTDMAVAALIALAAYTAHRPLLASVCVAVGSAVHETCFLFGTPLLVGLWFDHGAFCSISKKGIAGGILILFGALLLYSSSLAFPHSSPQDMVDVVRSSVPHRMDNDQVDWAIYFTISGARGLRTAVCQNVGDPSYFLHVMTGLFVIALFIVILKDERQPSTLAAILVSVPSFLFLSAIATDISRWAALAAFNVWLICAVRLQEPTYTRSAADWLRLLLAVLVIPLMSASLWRPTIWRIGNPVFFPTPIVELLIQSWGGPQTPSFATALQRCDPDWRSVLGGRSR